MKRCMLALAVLCSISYLLFAAEEVVPSEGKKISNTYTPRDYTYLLGMPGFSDQLLKMHFQLYEGYVKNTNFLLTTLRDWALHDKATTYEYTALKRRVGWEFDGMRLHEFYFDNLGGNGGDLEKRTPLRQRMLIDFGSYEQWKNDFIATGMTRGIGWVILYRDPQNGRLINTWIEEHDVGHLAGGTPLLVMDVFEHAYITQYGLDRQKYITVFFDNLNWDEIQKRYALAAGR